MNIIHPGDHVVCVIPTGHGSKEEGDRFQANMKEVAALLESGSMLEPGSGMRYTVTFLALGAKGSSPEVLFVVRKP